MEKEHIVHIIVRHMHNERRRTFSFSNSMLGKMSSDRMNDGDDGLGIGNESGWKTTWAPQTVLPPALSSSKCRLGRQGSRERSRVAPSQSAFMAATPATISPGEPCAPTKAAIAAIAFPQDFHLAA
jgi:hypothetical protein